VATAAVMEEGEVLAAMAAVVVAFLAAVAAVEVTTAVAVAVAAFTAAAVVGRTAVVAVVAPTAVAVAVAAVAADRIDNPKFLFMPARPEVPGGLFVFQACALLPAGSFLGYKLGISRELAPGSFTTLFVARC